MIYIYDNAIANDLARSIDPDSPANDIVKVIDPEGIMGIIAQLKEDTIKLPLVCLIRNPDTPIDTSRTNFTAIHKGVATFMDTEKQDILSEHLLPIKLSYTLNILATNTYDSDELLRELMFKYATQYFIDAEIPYEGSRKIRFGVAIDPGSISKKSGQLEYIQSGSLFETSMTLNVEGAMQVTYRRKHINRVPTDPGATVEVTHKLAISEP